MSRTKEALVVLLDAGFTMNTPLKERIHLKSLTKKETQTKTLTRFDAAIATVQSVVNQKDRVSYLYDTVLQLFYKPKDEIGVVLYGTQETNNQINEEQREEEDGEEAYTNVTVLSHFDIPTVALIKKLVALEPSKDPNVKVDILDGLIVSLDLLFRRTNNKKYERKLLVITDAASRISDADDLSQIVDMIQNMEVQVQIIGIDFDQMDEKKDTIKQQIKQEHTEANKQEPSSLFTLDKSINKEDLIKRENEKMLFSIAKEVHGDVKSVSKRMDMLTQGNKRAVSQVTKFRGLLEIGTTMGLPVHCYLKTKIATLPTLKKESQVSHDKNISGRIKMDRIYRSSTAMQENDNEIPIEKRVKAYRYGSEKVPFSSADMESFKFQTEKSLKLLGFVDQNQLKIAQFIGETDLFISEPNKPFAYKAFASFIQAMYELKVVGIARFVARKNAAPKIIALVPKIPNEKHENFYCFYGLQIPFEEDLRFYEFEPLLTKNKNLPSDEQQALADRLVDSLSIKEEKESEIGTCFNPCLVRFFQAVQERALDPNAIIPPLPDYVERCLSIDSKRLELIQEVVDAFDKGFQLKEAILKAKEQKKKSFWSDTTTLDDLKKEEIVLQNKTVGEKEEEEQEEEEEEEADSDLDLDELLEGGKITTIGSMNPIADFEAMIETKQPIKIRTAVHGIQAQIENLFLHGKQFYPKAIQTLRHFRLKSPELQCSSQFNTHLTMLKSKFHDTNDVWKTLQDAEVTLITNEEDPSVSITKIQAKVFLFGEEEELEVTSASISSQLENLIKEEEEDMFADFE